MRNKLYPAAAVGVAALVGSLVTSTPAYAGGGNFVEETGTCSMTSTWDMKAKPAANRIEMEFSVDTVKLGQAWSVRLTDNGALLWSGNRTTNGISMSFNVDKMLTDLTGTDSLVARAKNTKTGEVCRGHVTL